MKKIKIYLSSQTDPCFNLATEDYLFRHSEAETSVLFLWQNAPSIIIGRAQNPYLECQLNQMEEEGVLLARRQSGGGAVYHDLGNLNFTFISPLSGKHAYSKAANFSILLKALHRLDIPAIRSPRNDLLIQNRGEDRKISGSAFRESKTRAFHHGTLLVHSDLEKLSRYLTPSQKTIEAKGVKSIRSHVANLVQASPNLSILQVQKALIDSFFEHYAKSTSVSPEVLDFQTLKTLDSLRQCYEQYTSWDWKFGRTLPFSHHLEHLFNFGRIKLVLDIEQAVIQSAEFIHEGSTVLNFSALKQSLIQTRYEQQALQEALSRGEDLPEIRAWLKEALK